MGDSPLLEEEPAQPTAPAPSGPPPLEGGPPPLEEAPALAPPGLSAKPKPAASASAPPLLELPPLPPPLLLAPKPLPLAASCTAPAAAPPAALPAAPVLLAALDHAEAASPEDVRAATVDYLKKKPGGKDLLNRLGLYLRSRKLSPNGQLKRFIQQHCQGSVVVLDSKSGTDMAQLAEAAAAEKAAAECECRHAAAQAGAAPASAEARRPVSASSDNFDPFWLEQRLMQHCVELQQSGVQPTLPLLGSFCIDKLGLQMRGKLKPFLDRRRQLCSVSDDGRQHVQLTLAGTIIGCGTPSSAASPSAPLMGLAAGALPGSSRTGGNGGAAAAASTDQVATAVMPGVAVAQLAGKDYKKWDGLTKAIFQFVRSKGLATFTQIDAHVKESCAKLVIASGIPLSQWRSQFFLHKRRNIFRLQGLVVSLSSNVPDTAKNGENDASAAVAVAAVEDFPPLPDRSMASAATGCSGGGGSDGGSTPEAAVLGASAAVPTAANPLLAAFAAERQMLEQLRDDVEGKLASFKALSELQKENLGLRAACVTLGRELLALKSEFGAFQQQTASAIAVISPSAAAVLMSGSSALPADLTSPVRGMGAAGAGGEDAACTGYAAEAFQQQQNQQQANVGAFRGCLSSGDHTAAAATAMASVEVESAKAKVAAPSWPLLPMHVPAPAPPSMPMPRGKIVLVGGHDGGSWLDSVEYISPGEWAWASLPPLGQPRSFAAAVGTAAEVFVVGGGNGVEWFDSVVRFDCQAGRIGGWQELAPLQVARGSLAAGMASGYLFIFGGGKPKEQYNVVEWYDPQSNRWLPAPPLTRKRFALGGTALEDTIYAVGGYDGTTYLDCAERLDPRTDRWEALPGAMASKRGGHAVAAAGGLLYAMGGFNSIQAIPRCEVFDPRMNAWHSIADMSASRAYGSCAVLGSTVFAVGGLQSDMQTHAILLERYNPVNDSWEHVELPANANPRRSFLAACGLE